MKLRSIFILLISLIVVFATDYDGYFNILSYNVGGLPEPISSSKPSKYTKLISPKLNDYDVVNCQEDFAYNNDLVSQLK